MEADVVVIGGGMAGILAAMAARDRGRQVILLRKSPGATALSSGCIDICSDPRGISDRPYINSTDVQANIAETIMRRRNHPYSILANGSDSEAEKVFASIRDALRLAINNAAIDGLEYKGNPET